MPSAPRVLLVGHDASRTGAPAAALELVRWAVASEAVDLSVVLRRGGPLLRDYAAAAPTVVTGGRTARGLELVDHVLAAQRLPHQAVARLAERASVGSIRVAPTLVVANTLAALAPAVAFVPARARLVCWVHELDGVADRVLPRERRNALLARVDHFVAAGRWTARMLVDRFGIPHGDVTCVDEPIAPIGRGTPAPTSGGAPVQVLGVGSLTARKGPDAFVAAVALLAASRPDLRAAWVGSGDPGVRAQVEADIAAAGLGGRIQLAGDAPSLDPWWPSDGLLLHTAREDPFPLVVAEAGARAVPVVTWATGAAADLLARSGSAHLVAPAGDVIGLARRAAALLDDAPARRRAGLALREEAVRLVADRQAPMVWAACTGDRR